MSRNSSLGIASLTIAGFLIYLALVARVTPFDIVMGLGASLAVAVLTHSLVVKSPTKLLNPVRLAYLLAYGIIFLFVIEPACHLDTAKRFLGRSLNIRPGILRVPYRVRSGYGIACVACSITNTPGTVVVDIDEDKGVYYVHKLYVETEDEEANYASISKPYEVFVRKVFEG